MADTKKPKKIVRVNSLINQFRTKEANIPGMTDEALIAQIQLNNYTVSEKELQEIVDKELIASDKVEDFVAFLQLAECITKSGGSSSGGGERSTTIDSIERAREVANDPTNEDEILEISEIMSEAIGLRKRISKLIGDKAELSLALKNKKIKKKDDDAVESPNDSESASDSEDEYPTEDGLDSKEL